MSTIEPWGGLGPVLLVVAGGALVVAVLAMLFNCIQSCRFLRAYRQALGQRISGLRIHKMLESLGISRRRYMRKALTADVEVHLHRCEQCPSTAQCDAAMRRGDPSDGDTFCPNFRELVKFSPRRPLRPPAGVGRAP